LSWDTTNIEGSTWIWDPAEAGSYKYRNSQGLGNLTDGIIPISHAFFIRAKTAAPSFTIPTDARIHSNQAYYKNSIGNKDNPPYIILN
jgi:hypothetical protein